MDLWIAAAARHISKFKGFMATFTCDDGSRHGESGLLTWENTVWILLSHFERQGPC